VIPICYVYDRGSLYSSIDEKPKRRNPTHLRRVLNIIENPNVALVVDQYGEDWSRLKYVTLRGFAEILSTGAEYERAIRLLREKYAQYRRMRLESRPIIKIRLISVFAWRPLGGGHPKSQVPSEPI
jgi:PPOX class probable F420-dependent enzyme